MELSAAALFDKFALSYQEKYMDVSLYKESLDVFCNHLSPDVSVLDIACGPGNMSRYILDRRKDVCLHGIDLSPNMVMLARHNVPGSTFEIMDCRDISRLSQQYGGIMCAFILPYLTKAEALQLIEHTSHLLLSAGILYLSFMEGANKDSFVHTNSSGDSVATNFHEKDYLADALNRLNMRIFYSVHMPSPSAATVQTNDMVVIARKG